jgi:hypothetical protein
MERLLAMEARQQWQLERYRRAAEWVALRLPGAVMAQEKAREREAGAASGGDAKAAKRGFTRLFKFGRLMR